MATAQPETEVGEVSMERRSFIKTALGATAACLTAGITFPESQATPAMPVVHLGWLNAVYKSLSYGNDEPDLILVSPRALTVLIWKFRSAGPSGLHRLLLVRPQRRCLIFRRAVIREIEGQPDYLFRFINSRRPFDPHFNRE